jgi:hypothetical protein
MAKKYFCKDCGEEKSPKGVYCKVCRYKYAKRPSGLKYNIKVKNKAWFKKGNVPWNEGKKLPYDVWNKGTKGVVKENRTSFKKGENVADENFAWKGDRVGYFALHTWMRRNFDWAEECKFCGSKDNLELANIEYIYNRDPKNWEVLCHGCHQKYDRQNNWGYATEKFNLRGGLIYE